MKKSGLYTRTGDGGQTSLVGGQRVDKTSDRLEAYGTVDELNAALGSIIVNINDSASAAFLTWLQSRMFDLGSYLATDADDNAELAGQMFPDIDQAVERIEHEIDRIDAMLPPLKSFVLPQGSASAVAAHVARTVCRRAERRVLTLAKSATVSPEALRLLNRMSDYLFALARFCNISENVDEIFWNKSC
jgi:cob(I)alamin adenosyltransferase